MSDASSRPHCLRKVPRLPSRKEDRGCRILFSLRSGVSGAALSPSCWSDPGRQASKPIMPRLTTGTPRRADPSPMLAYQIRGRHGRRAVQSQALFDTTVLHMIVSRRVQMIGKAVLSEGREHMTGAAFILVTSACTGMARPCFAYEYIPLWIGSYIMRCNVCAVPCIVLMYDSHDSQPRDFGTFASLQWTLEIDLSDACTGVGYPSSF